MLHSIEFTNDVCGDQLIGTIGKTGTHYLLTWQWIDTDRVVEHRDSGELAKHSPEQKMSDFSSNRTRKLTNVCPCATKVITKVS